MLEVTLRHRFATTALDIAFQAPAGVTALFGRSGAGKTSVVNAVAGLFRPDHAEIRVAGRDLTDLPPHKRRVGYVFQDARLFPHLSVRGNLTYGQRFLKAPPKAALPQIVEMLGIGDLLSRRPGALSGGETQRVAIGRALLSDPDILLMDEPLAALDMARKDEILPYLERLRAEAAMPILYVSHAMEEVARLATTLVVLEGGRVVQSGPLAQVLADPDALPSLGVRMAGAVLPGRVQAHHADGLTEIAVSGGTLLLPRTRAAIGTSVRVRVDAQDVILARTRPEGLSALNVLAAEVTQLRPGAGPGMAVQLRVGEDLILARITQRSGKAMGLEPGMACYAVFKSVSIAQQDVGGA